LNYYKVEKREDLYYLIGNNEVVLPESPIVFYKIKETLPKSENLFMKYMKQAMSAMKKSSVETSPIVPQSDSNKKIYRPLLPLIRKKFMNSRKSDSKKISL